MKKIILILIPMVLLGLGCRKNQNINQNIQPIQSVQTAPAVEAPEEPLGTFFKIKTGDIFGVNGLLFEIKSINSLTSQGCTGGPTGCPDSVEINVSFQGESQDITLVVLGGTNQTASSERAIFGHRVILSSVNENNAMLGVFLRAAQ